MAPLPVIFDSYPRTPKVWGEEILLCNTDFYCAKLLQIHHGMQCSLHMHPLKCETFIVLEGRPLITIDKFTEEKWPGDQVYIPRGTYHRFAGARFGAVLLEISTHHDDRDVVRKEESGPTLHD